MQRAKGHQWHAISNHRTPGANFDCCNQAFALTEKFPGLGQLMKWRFFANPIAGGAEPDHNVVVNMLRLVTTVPLLLVMCPHLLTGQTNSLVLKTTVCAVADKPSAFDGTLVQIEATYAGSFEGSY